MELTGRVVAAAREHVLQQYGSAIGRPRRELVTPALVLDVAAAERNIIAMQRRLEAMGSTTIRPHYKTHKSPELARRQIVAGARGISVATVWEAEVLADAGMDDLFVVNTVCNPDKLRVLARLARDRRILVAVDDTANATALSDAARDAGSTVGMLVEVDTGMDRCGVDTGDEALALARHVLQLPRVRFEGLTGYEGHCSLEFDLDTRHELQQKAMRHFNAVADLLESQGVPCLIRSAGGFSTWQWTAATPGITEIQAGTYVLMDGYYARMVEGFEQALTVQASVISRSSGRVVVDCGSKSVAEGNMASIVGHDCEPFRFDEEHGIFGASDRCALKVGDSVTLIPGYAPSTVNCYDAYHIVQDDVVVDIWPVVPRGPGSGFATP